MSWSCSAAKAPLPTRGEPKVMRLFESVKKLGCLTRSCDIKTLHIFFIGNSIFYLSLEFWKMRLKVAERLLSFIVDFYTIMRKSPILKEKKSNLRLGSC